MRLFGLRFVGFKDVPWRDACDCTASGVRPSFKPATRVGVFCWASVRSAALSAGVHGLPLLGGVLAMHRTCRTHRTERVFAWTPLAARCVGETREGPCCRDAAYDAVRRSASARSSDPRTSSAAAMRARLATDGFAVPDSIRCSHTRDTPPTASWGRRRALRRSRMTVPRARRRGSSTTFGTRLERANDRAPWLPTIVGILVRSAHASPEPPYTCRDRSGHHRHDSDRRAASAFENTRFTGTVNAPWGAWGPSRSGRRRGPSRSR